MIDKISIVLAGDEGITPGLFATIASIMLACNRNRTVVFHFLDTGLRESTKKLLEKFLCQFANASLQVHKVDLSVFSCANKMRGGYSSYARLLFRRYVPEDRVLYIDTDFLVMKDVSTLFDMDMKGAFACATRTPTIKLLTDDNPFYDAATVKDIPYFNAGIMLFDCKKWDENHCEKKIMDWVTSGTFLKYHDQTLLNSTFKGNWLDLGKDWGLMMIHNTTAPMNTNYHFGGAPKPWNGKCTFISAPLWWAVYDVAVAKYYQIPHASAIRAKIFCREMLLESFLSVFGGLLAMFPRLSTRVNRLRERKSYFKIFRRTARTFRETHSGR